MVGSCEYYNGEKRIHPSVLVCAKKNRKRGLEIWNLVFALKHWELRRSRPNRTSIGLPHASSSPSFSRSLHVFPMFSCNSLPGKPFPISFLRRLFGFRWGPQLLPKLGLQSVAEPGNRGGRSQRVECLATPAGDDDLFQSAAWPDRVSKILFNQYETNSKFHWNPIEFTLLLEFF